MKKILFLSLLLLLASPVWAADFKSGDELIAAMYAKYKGKWYDTLTFKQKTTNYKPDGTSEVSIWYEALRVPGKLRIDFEPLEKREGLLFADGKLNSFKDGKLARSMDFAHPLLILGFDIYGQPAEQTITQVRAMNIDLSVIHQEIWQGKSVYVVGAKEGDLKSPQFWVDKKDLLFVRLIEPGVFNPKVLTETQFNKYEKAGGGWVAAEVKMFADGKLQTTEEYTEIKTGIKLDADLWDPQKWGSVDRKYIKKK